MPAEVRRRFERRKYNAFSCVNRRTRCGMQDEQARIGAVEPMMLRFNVAHSRLRGNHRLRSCPLVVRFKPFHDWSVS